jgi:hypothetical protein
VPRNKTTFAAGNQAALRHGGRSRIAVESHANQVREELTALLSEHLPHVTAADGPLVDLAVDVTTKLRLLADYFDRTSGGSLIDGRGKPRAASELYLRLHRQCLAVFDRLGIGPASRVQIMASLGTAQTSRQRLAIETQKRLQADYGTAPKELES